MFNDMSCGILYRYLMITMKLSAVYRYRGFHFIYKPFVLGDNK